MPGPPASHPSVRRRANKKKTAAELQPPPDMKGPKLPAEYVIGFTPHGEITRSYDDRTRRWWDKIRTSPHAGAYLDTHWEWLLLLAPLFDRWVAMADLDAFKELRLQAPPFGLRPSDANKLDWTIDPAVTGPVPQQAADQVDEPPRNGKGSSTAVWYRYATEVLELAIPEDASRADIISAVDQHKNGRPARQDPRLRVYDGEAKTGS